ncbi:MAG: hypothetical protein JWO71_4748 [Candidatus Acidoferrum typicum]|jgi:hypothetical protein|nr:hypothetical protein [Candidatus Acidoferrum typicum]
MPANLTKIENGEPVVSDAFKNQQTLKCPRCERTYLLAYSDSNEWHWVKEWLKIAKAAMRKEHDSKHATPTIPLEWHLRNF